MYVCACVQDLLSELASDAATGDKLGDMVEEEMTATADAVESAALRIQDMLRKSREDDSGLKLEVNERILDSCTELMKAIKVLIARSRDLQEEIIKEGMVRKLALYLNYSLSLVCCRER